MRKLIIVLLILIATASTALLTHAWFTYVQRKSVASFVSNEIIVSAKVNEELLLGDFELDQLAYIDFEDDLINDLSYAFNEMGTSISFDVILDKDSPLSRHLISVELSHPALIMLVVYEGLNLDLHHEKNKEYHALIDAISFELSTKEDIRNAIDIYNTNVFTDISSLVIFPGDELSFQLVFWVDYDLIEVPENYLDYTFSMTIRIGTASAKKR